jgi:hypothetical protein
MRVNMNGKDDDQWLAALAGKPDISADSAINAQAQALRRAMLERREGLELAYENLDSGEFQRLQTRLQREGLLKQARTNQKWLPDWLHKHLPSKNGQVVTLPIWSLGVNAVLAVVVVVQLGVSGSAPSQQDVLRGDQGTVLRVVDPQARLSELMLGLDAAKARYVIQRTTEGELIILVQADDAALDYLNNQRIGAQAKDGLIVIRLKNL